MKESLSDEVVPYFEKTIGPVDPLALIEIVPSTWPPIAIHLIQPSPSRDYLTLFTTGMSDQAMTVPAGSEDYRYAELFMQLPANWPFGKDVPLVAENLWPMQCLRTIAGYVHASEGWLGGPVTIFAGSEPPEPLAPNVKFTSLLLLAKEKFISEDGRMIHLYHATPLHTEERDLEIREGIGALLRAFDREKVSFVVDLERKSVAKALPGYYMPLASLGCALAVAIPVLLILWIWIPGIGWWSLYAFGGLVAILLALHFLAGEAAESASKEVTDENAG